MKSLAEFVDIRRAFDGFDIGFYDNGAEFAGAVLQALENAGMTIAPLREAIPARTSESCWLPYRHDDPSCPQYRRTK